MESAEDLFFTSPPWAGRRKEKYKLGLRPILREDWFSQPVSGEVAQHKKDLLDKNYDQVVAVADDGSAELALLNFLPNKKRLYPDAIADMALQVEDDLCIMEVDGRQRLLAACVCSPSYWNLRDKIGKSMRLIHENVPTLNHKVGNTIERFFKQCTAEKPFERRNWFIHGTDQRFNLSPEDPPETHPRNWYIRSERETVCKLDENFLLFTINTEFYPLKAIFNYEQARTDLMAAIDALDTGQKEYFGGFDKCLKVLSYLDTANSRLS